MNLTDTQKAIIRILFTDKEKSRSALAKDLLLSNAGLSLAIKPLIEEKMIIASGKVDSSKVGRKELNLKLNPAYGSFFGIDVRKHFYYYGLMDFSGELKLSGRVSTIEELSHILEKYQRNVMAIGVTIRGLASQKDIQSRYPELYTLLEKSHLPFCHVNNVDALADIYSLYHPLDYNFLLVKYGPGVGSSIYVEGKSLANHSEFGHMLYQDKTLEDTISYQAILKKDYEEEEAFKLILKQKELLISILQPLAFSLYNADSLLGLQKIVLSGLLLSEEEIKNALIEEIKKKDKTFDENKLVIYQDYPLISLKKSCLIAFLACYR